VKGSSRRLLFLLLASGFVAGCELLAGIDDITYSPDAGMATSGAVGSSGNLAQAGDGQPQTTGTSEASGSGAQSGSVQAGQDDDATASGASGSISQSGSSGSVASGSTRSGSTSGSSGSALRDSGPDSTVGSSGSAEPRDTSTGDVNRVCVPTSAAGTLPFVVDSVYAPTGVFGTGALATGATCAVARSSAMAKGSCHTATYTPADAGTFGGVFWQDDFNWGTQGGYAIPACATKITFSAMGKAGGEKVSFIAGYSGAATAATPCTDTVRADSGPLTLTTTWTPYTITLSGGYPEGVLGAFGWEADAPGAPASTLTFYVDDIQYQ
jgi:hypothetical protein